MDSEKRKGHRQTLKYPAKLDFGDGTPLVSCILTDVSASGARFAVEHPDKIPDNFSLLLAPEHHAKRRCKVMWREANQIGVEFVKVAKVKGPRLSGAVKVGSSTF